ncbi:MAG: insulinase family protein [Planctomycetota bacterium]|nr:MAG: insulinase family protein [Planctomycetota bacterium]
MKKSWVSAIAFLLAAATGASAQQVSFERYELPNGMMVILHEDHSLPVATINTWFYVGSKDEQPGRSGFAHLFEHLMFMGTRRVPGNDFDVLMERGGGWNNASTSEDRTNYYSFGPSSLLPTLLWLDADRLEDLGKEMTQEKLDKQREVVRNERRQTSEMQPYGKTDLKIGELMYPPDHPYHHTVIGSHEDLEAATLQDVKDFFARYYVPNNACLVVAGNFDPKEIKPLIDKLFGTLPRGAAPLHKTAGPVTLDEVRRVTYTDRVQYPRLSLVYHSPAQFKPGDAEMDLAAAILGAGKSSRLYRRLVIEEKLATDVSASQLSAYLGSLFLVQITALPAAPRERVEQVTEEVLADFVLHGPTPAELQRQQTAIEYEKVTEMESLMNRADKLNEYQFHLGDPNGFERDLGRYRNATVATVRDWASRIIAPNGRLVMWVLPEKQAVDLIAARDNRPAPAADRGFSAQPPQRLLIGKRLGVQFWPRTQLPLVHVSLMIRGGATRDDPAKAGLTYLMANMLDEGTGSLSAVEFAEALEELGADLTISPGQEFIHIDLTVLKRNFQKAMDLVGETILHPAFDEKEWERVKRLHLDSLRQAEDRASSVATRVGLRAFFGDAHPYGRPVEGTIETVEKLTLDDVRRCYARTILPAAAMFFVAGDVAETDVLKSLDATFSEWNATGENDFFPDAKIETSMKAAPTLTMPPPANKALRVVVVDKPDAVQTVIRFYMPGITYGSPERLRYEAISTILGGSFTSRLNQNLREDKGYTYGARSGFTMGPSVGYLSAGADVQAKHTGAALREFLAEFKKIRGGDITPEEASKARETNRMELVQGFEGLEGLVGTARLLEQNGLPFSTISDDLSAIPKITEGELNALTSKAIQFESGLIVLIGNKKLIEEQLKGLELPPPEELTVQGESPRSPSLDGAP